MLPVAASRKPLVVKGDSEERPCYEACGSELLGLLAALILVPGVAFYAAVGRRG